MTWNLVTIGVGTVILILLITILRSKKFWRAWKYLVDLIANKTIGYVIELNPFNILERQIEDAEKNRENVKVQGQKVRGEKLKLQTKLDKKYDELKKVMNLVTISQESANYVKDHNKTDFNNHMKDVLLNTKKVELFSNYIKEVKPIVEDLAFIEDFCGRVYDVSASKIEMAKLELEVNRDKYNAVMSGLTTAKASWKALMGDEDLNRDVELALNSIHNKISQSLGEIQTTMKLTSDVMRGIEKDDVALTLEGMNKIKAIQTVGVENYFSVQNPEYEKQTNILEIANNLLLNK